MNLMSQAFLRAMSLFPGSVGRHAKLALALDRAANAIHKWIEWVDMVNRQAATTPPDPDGMNADRAARAEYALVAFESQTGADRESSLGDLLSNLMHWADRNGHDFSIALERAKAHYEIETGGEAA